MNGDKRLKVAARVETDRVVLELAGELDLAGAPLLAVEIERAEGQPQRILVLDMEALDFIDSAGLRVILAAHERARERGEELALTPGRPQVQRLLSIAGVRGHLQTIASPEAELAPGSGSPQAP